MNDINGTSNVVLLKENEDGSAVYQFDFPQEAVSALTRLGILTAIEAGLAIAKKLSPDYEADPEFTEEIKDLTEEADPEFTEEIKNLAEDAGFAMWRDESYKPEGEVVDWACKYDKELVKFYHLVKEKYDN